MPKTWFFKIIIIFKNGFITISHLEAVLWRVKSSGVGQSKITKKVVLAGLGGKG